MLRETEEERQKGKTKKRITENKRLHPNSAEFDRCGSCFYPSANMG